MPKLKRPDPLQKMALGVLFEFVVNYSDQLSVNGTANDLRHGVTIIKKHICNNIPWYLLADFCNRFIDEFLSKERSVCHYEAALEMLMDTEIVGLPCKGPILAYLDSGDVHRFRKLQELDLEYSPATVHSSLENFQLNELTTFIFAKQCNDVHLSVIGRNCSKLQVLKIRESNVTDEGLRALNSCSELRVVDIIGCPVSYSGINNLLSTNKKIEEFAHWDGSGHPKGCDILAHLDSSVCRSISRFVFQNDRKVRPVDLQSIVAKFPNLNYVKIISIISEDLSILKSLKKLKALELDFLYEIYYSQIEATWQSLKELLTCIGENIETLKLSCWDQGHLWHQDHVDFIFDSCPNLEYLGFDQGDGLVVIPPFPKLKQLFPRIPIEFKQIEILYNPVLEFSRLPNLETLSLLNYGVNLQAIESIILDDVRFPNLKLIETNCVKADDLVRIERITRNKNLDFKVKNDPKSNWYTRYRFGDTCDTDDDDDDDDDEDDDDSDDDTSYSSDYDISYDTSETE